MWGLFRNDTNQLLKGLEMNDLMVCGVKVRQTEDGLYCLNDLHKAAGGEKRHAPNYFIDLDSTKDYVSYLKDQYRESGNDENQILRTARGGNGETGTFANLKMLYSYSYWIDVKFQDKVLTVFDSYVKNEIVQMEKEIRGLEAHNRLLIASRPIVLDASQRKRVSDAVNEKARVQKIDYRKLYRAIYTMLNVNSYKDIQCKYLATALQIIELYPKHHSVKVVKTLTPEMQYIKHTNDVLYQALDNLTNLHKEKREFDKRFRDQMSFIHSNLYNVIEEHDDFLTK